MKESQVEEFLDIVDQDDNVISSMPRSKVYEQQLFAQMRSVWLMLKNRDGQLWIPRRAYDRKILPGYLDGSVVGHVSAGESYEQALIRETHEEVGLDLVHYDYSFLGKVTPFQDQAFCFAAVFECHIDTAPKNWNKHEFAGWSWLYPEQLIEQYDQGILMKDTLPIILKKFYTK